MSNMNNTKKEPNIYILKVYGPNSAALYKFGYTSNLYQRLDAYKRTNPFIELIATGYAHDGQAYEQFIHRQFTAAWGNEWYLKKDLKELKLCLNQPEGAKVLSIEGRIIDAIEEEAKNPYIKLTPTRIARKSKIDATTVRRYLKTSKLTALLQKLDSKDRLFTTDKGCKDLIDFLEDYNKHKEYSPTKVEHFFSKTFTIAKEFVRIFREHHNLSEYVTPIHTKRTVSDSDILYMKSLLKEHNKKYRYLATSISKSIEIAEGFKNAKAMEHAHIRRIYLHFKSNGMLDQYNIDAKFKRVDTLNKYNLFLEDIKSRKYEEHSAPMIMGRYSVKFVTAHTFKELGKV